MYYPAGTLVRSRHPLRGTGIILSFNTFKLTANSSYYTVYSVLMGEHVYSFYEEELSLFSEEIEL